MASTIGTGGNYTTITAWEAALGGGGADDEGLCFDEAFDENFTINAGTSPSLGPNPGAEHDTTESSGARVSWSQDRGTIELDQSDGVIEHLEFDGNGFHAGTGSQILLDSGSSNMSLRRMLIHHFNRDEAGGIDTVKIRRGRIMNSFLYYNQDSGSGGGHFTAIDLTEFLSFDSEALNCTLHGNENNGGSGNARGIEGQDDANVICKNCLVTDTGGSSSGTLVDYDSGFGASSDTATNLSSDSTAPSPATGEPVSSSVEYVSTADPPDLRLASGAESIDVGTDLVTTPTGVNLDILERDRDAQGDTWDVGAHEFVAAVGTAVQDPIMRGIIPFSR